MSRIFINTSDISGFEGLSIKRASDIIRSIRDAFDKEKPQKITILEYCQYRGVPETEIRKHMKP